MSKKLLFASALIAGIVFSLPAAMAQGVCGDRDLIVAKLNSDLGEVRVDGAAASSSTFYEFYASQSTRTWTILLTGVNGVSCVVAAGEDWRRPIKSVSSAQDDWPRPGALLVR